MGENNLDESLPVVIHPKLIPLDNVRELEVFLESPKTRIAEAITGALSLGRSDAIQMGARLVQGVIKGTAMKQVGREIKELIEKGKIKEDYAEEKYGFQSLSDLLQFIDGEAPDEERFTAVKALFYSVISASEKDGNDILNYKLFKIAMRLSATQILILKVSYDLLKIGDGSQLNGGASQWLDLIAKKIGHGVSALVEDDEDILIENHLLTGRSYPDKSGISSKNFRLTDLAIKFCETLEKFSKFCEK